MQKILNFQKHRIFYKIALLFQAAAKEYSQDQVIMSESQKMQSFEGMSQSQKKESFKINKVVPVSQNNENVKVEENNKKSSVTLFQPQFQFPEIKECSQEDLSDMDRDESENSVPSESDVEYSYG